MSSLSEDNFLCAICLDLMSEPVSLPCGHNFCKACINQHWKDKDLCQCPLCNEKFTRGLKLHVNTAYRDIVENFKKNQVKNLSPVKEGEVPCDHCLGTKLKAVKTCLVCLSSYCEIHLEPHQRHTALMSHKLTDPVKRLSNQICKKHRRLLKYFCRDDLTSFCELCRQHQAHNTAPLEEEYEEKRAQLERNKVEVEEMIQERKKKAQELEEAAQIKRRDSDEAIANTAQTFANLVASAQRPLVKLLQTIEAKQTAADRKTDMLVKELKEEITELQRRRTNLDNMSNIKDHLKLIKNVASFSTPRTKNWSDISNQTSQHCEEAVRRALDQLVDAFIKDMQQAGGDFRVCCSKVLADESVEESFETVTDLESLPDGIRLDIIRRQYSVDMTFDPCTSNDLLLFSEDAKKVRTSHIWWFENVRHKFNRYAYVLGNKGFSRGRFYYEVEARLKTGWDLGIVKASVRGMKKFTPNFRNGNCWIIRLRNNTQFKALDYNPVSLPLTRKPERVGMFVDYEKKSVSFYDVDAASLIYSFTGCSFNLEEIFPFFSPGPADDGLNDTPLVLSPAPPAKEQTQKPQTQNTNVQEQPPLNYTILTIILFVFSIFISKVMGEDSSG
ncbi:E3 ubiquitin-protein ligase TRIM21-like [Aulostomus maculatus]